MLTNVLPTNVGSPALFNRTVARPSQAAALLPMDRRRRFVGRYNEPAGREAHGLDGRLTVDAVSATVEISPPDIVKRRTVAWDGMTVEIVRATTRERIESRFRGPVHLLAICEEGARSNGDTFVEGLPLSSLRDLKKKLTFVPADHEYHEWQEPRILSRMVYFYLDPASMPLMSETGFMDLTPRLHFEDAALRETALKLTTLVESAGADNRLYLEALGVVLAHELARCNSGTSHIQAPIRGGLAAWQQRVVTTYIEEHLSEQISLATLAQLVRLSPYYFCRAFKQSFGIPPHRYHTSRRIEHAKALLAKPEPSVTDIGLTVGFSETSSFTAAFRKATGFTPTGYHRSLG
jgi:AraC family transcriptional regulator